MPTQSQFDIMMQPIRNIDCKVAVLDYDFYVLDEISGLIESVSFDIDADSDIRRTADVSMVLKSDSSTNERTSFYWSAGNQYWFDKYIQIYVAIEDIKTGEFVWTNMGVYLINSPSISYNATTNTLSFQAVDLMSKMTGMRNGQLEGMTYVVPIESNIKEAIESVLVEQGFTKYILYDPPYEKTPEEIRIDAGGTTYDLLCQLRDINPNWEMFFDVDGVFHFQQIPSGKVDVNGFTLAYNGSGITGVTIDEDTWFNQMGKVDGTYVFTYVGSSWQYQGVNVSLSTYGLSVSGTVNANNTISVTYTVYGEPFPLVNDEMWAKLNAGYSYDTSFEDVKNYVEVLGKVHQINELATVTSTVGSAIVLTLSKPISSYLDAIWTVGFGIDIDTSGVPKALGTPLRYIYVYDSANTFVKMIDISDDPIIAGNEQYVLDMTVADTISTISIEYIGMMQPRAWAIENNPDSPFYVGALSEYTCSTGYTVDMADERTTEIADVNATVASNVAYIDIRPWLSASDFSSAQQGDSWVFKVNVVLSRSMPITTIVVYGAGVTTTSTAYNLSNNPISLDYSQEYMLVVTKGATSTPSLQVLYYPSSASDLPMSSTSEINIPKFRNQVRYVCSGDEYDNIYTNELCEQRARYEIYLRARLHDNISITCVPIYWLDVNQIIEYTLPNNTTGEPDLWLVKSISTDLTPSGTQTIVAMRYYPLYADISLENLATQ